MLSVGLTGNIASGKSLVARQLELHGATIIDADRIGHELIGNGGVLVPNVLSAFGAAVAAADGGIDRGKLGAFVFADPAARQRLNAIVHPCLVAEIRSRLAALARAESGEDYEGGPPVPTIVAVDAALIFELGVESDFDVVVVVTADEATRLARLAARGLSPEAAGQRMASQWPEAEKIRRADHVIVNDGTPEELAGRVAILWTTLTRAAASPRRGKEQAR